MPLASRTSSATCAASNTGALRLPAATVRSCVPPDVGTVRTVFSATAICLTVPVALSAVM
jgi:hypothetical protein